MLLDAGTFINGMIYHRYKLPFTTIPGEIHFIANRLAAMRNIGLLKLGSTSVRVGWNSIWLSEPEGSDAYYNPTLTLITIPT